MIWAWRNITGSKTLTKRTSAPRASESPKKGKTAKGGKVSEQTATQLADFIHTILEQNSAEDVVRLDLRGKSSIADFMIVASGRSNRHVHALSDYVLRGLKEAGHQKLGIEGQGQSDWVLVDSGDVIIHLFRPEVREYYALEKMWSLPANATDTTDSLQHGA